MVYRVWNQNILLQHQVSIQMNIPDSYPASTAVLAFMLNCLDLLIYKVNSLKIVCNSSE